MPLKPCYSKSKTVEGIKNSSALSREDIKKERQELFFH